MPSTPTYSYPYPAPTDQPDVPQDIRDLAEALDTETQRIDGDTADVASDVAALSTLFANTGAQTIATIDTGQGTNTTTFTAIPQTFRDLVIHWTGTSDGATELDSLALRFNDDSGDNYFSRLSRNEAVGTYTSSAGTFSVLRAGQVGTRANRRSGGTVWIPDYSTDGRTKTVHGISIGRGQSGGDNIFTTQAGGTWTGTSPITTIRIWVSGALWGVTPHITLVGYP